MAEAFKLSDEAAALSSERELLLESKRIFEERLRALQAEEASLRVCTDSPADSSLQPSQPALMLLSQTPSRAAEQPAKSPVAPPAGAHGAQAATPGVQELLLDTLGADSPWLAAGPAR